MVAASGMTPIIAQSKETSGSLALLGGTPVRGKDKRWQPWPQWDSEKWDPQMNEVMAKRVWSRSRKVTEFEQKWAEMNGSKHCLSTVNGTNALSASWMQSNTHPATR